MKDTTRKKHLPCTLNFMAQLTTTKDARIITAKGSAVARSRRVRNCNSTGCSVRGVLMMAVGYSNLYLLHSLDPHIKYRWYSV